MLISRAGRSVSLNAPCPILRSTASLPCCARCAQTSEGEVAQDPPFDYIVSVRLRVERMRSPWRVSYSCFGKQRRGRVRWCADASDDSGSTHKNLRRSRHLCVGVRDNVLEKQVHRHGCERLCQYCVCSASATRKQSELCRHTAVRCKQRSAGERCHELPDDVRALHTDRSIDWESTTQQEQSQSTHSKRMGFRSPATSRCSSVRQ